MKEIPLTQGKVALVDDADYPILAAHKWYAHKHRNTFYARRNAPSPSGKRRQQNIKMHRQILGFPDGPVDHRDMNGLNNQRENLRVATNSGNNANSRKRQGTASSFRGVYFDKYGWKAQITVRGKQRYLGFFSDEVSAALAYNKAASSAFGEFAQLNMV